MEGPIATIGCGFDRAVPCGPLLSLAMHTVLLSATGCFGGTPAAPEASA
jgi:hypothetical protein